MGSLGGDLKGLMGEGRLGQGGEGLKERKGKVVEWDMIVH